MSEKSSCINQAVEWKIFKLLPILSISTSSFNYTFLKYFNLNNEKFVYLISIRFFRQFDLSHSYGDVVLLTSDVAVKMLTGALSKW